MKNNTRLELQAPRPFGCFRFECLNVHGSLMHCYDLVSPLAHMLHYVLRETSSNFVIAFLTALLSPPSCHHHHQLSLRYAISSVMS